MEIQIGCPCPPKADGSPRHESDTVTLRATIDFPTAVLLQKSIQVTLVESPDSAEVLAMLTRFYVRHCIEAWTLTDEKDKGLAVTPENIVSHLESNLDAAMAVAEAMDNAYSEIVLPLVTRALGSLQATPSSKSTSVTTNGSPKPRKRSKRSSTSTTQMVVTAPITWSPGGDSSSSRTAASAD